MRYYILFVLFSLFIPLLSPASVLSSEDYKFKRIDVDKGLSHSEVKCIYKSRSGFMWFGTTSGLNRYDGNEILTLKYELTVHTPANNNIMRIQEDAEGNLWLTTRTGYAIYNPSAETFVPDVQEKIGSYTLDKEILNLYIDRASNFWFITDEDVRMYDSKKKNTTIFVTEAPHGLSKGNIIDICQGINCYWFIFDTGLLECMDAQTHQIIYRDTYLVENEKITQENELKLFVDTAGDLWIYGFRNYFGIAHLEVSDHSWQIYSTYSEPQFRITSDIVDAIEEDDKGYIWIGTDHGGLNILNKKTGQIIALYNDENKPNTIAQNTIKSLYKDNNGIMWVGTYKKGLCYYHESIFKFKAVTDKTQIPFNDINCFHETPSGNIWIGTNGGGLIYFDRINESYNVFKHDPVNPNSPAGDVIVSLEADLQGRLWIGYYMDGVDCYDGKTFTHYNQYSNRSNVLTDDNGWTLLCDRNGHLWIGTLLGGVVVINPNTGERVNHFDANGSVYDIICTKAQDILIASQAGLLIYDSPTNTLKPYEEDIFEPIQLGKNDINDLYEDHRKLLWIGTRNGLFCFNPITREVSTFNEKNGLSADLIQSILEDEDNNMWIATNRGLTRIKVSTSYETPGYFFQLQRYDSSEGLQNEQFNFNAAYLTSQSELIFGGSSGFNIFTPHSLHYNTNAPEVVITGLHLYNHKLSPNEKYNGRTILTTTITETKKINLRHSDNFINFTFSALDYFMPNKVRYYYKLEGFNDQWIEADPVSRRVTYTNLKPGNYIFQLKAVNNDGIESKVPATLSIRVTPPFWRTTWAWCIYFLLLILLFILLRRRMLKKAERRLENEKEKLRLAQKHEMDELKLRFFTNISHEFRTPLTLILTPLDELLKKASGEEKESLSIIHRNAQQLLRLVNQLLDFRKLDVHRHSLQESLGDIVQFVKEQISLFEESMRRKQIRFTFHTSLTRFYMHFDADKLSKCLMNILSNAYKFTPTNGEITVELERIGEDKIAISISDTGIGIPEESLEKIFDRFYQVQTDKKSNYQGSGIGLHLTKEFIQLHHGSIRAENRPAGGASFIIHLPCKEDVNPIQETSSEGYPSEEAGGSTTPGFHDDDFLTDNTSKLLIVEDNEELRRFLISKFKEEYNILEAEDGEKGLELALQEIPDMIVSDIMMPKMDGIEMSKQIKSDIRTSHIPLILLTAKTGEESKLEGLRAGADDYITKPFNFEILSVKIRNLIEAQKKNQTLFKEQIKIEPSKITVSSLDEKLINKALEYTEQNISNPDFSVEELSRELGMSRVHLYKKLSSLTGKTPIEFIRIIRLKRAAQLLNESQLTVSEIAYEVGFNNPKYFRKYFKEEFGVLPSQYGLRNE